MVVGSSPVAVTIITVDPRNSLYIMWVYDKQLQELDNDVISHNKLKVNHLSRRLFYLRKKDMKAFAFILIECSRDL